MLTIRSSSTAFFSAWNSFSAAAIRASRVLWPSMMRAMRFCSSSLQLFWNWSCKPGESGAYTIEEKRKGKKELKKGDAVDDSEAACENNNTGRGERNRLRMSQTGWESSRSELNERAYSEITGRARRSGGNVSQVKAPTHLISTPQSHCLYPRNADRQQPRA